MQFNNNGNELCGSDRLRSDPNVRLYPYSPYGCAGYPRFFPRTNTMRFYSFSISGHVHCVSFYCETRLKVEWCDVSGGQSFYPTASFQWGLYDGYSTLRFHKELLAEFALISRRDT